MRRQQAARSLLVRCPVGFLLAIIFTYATFPNSSLASGYGYQSDVDNLATVDSARQILSQTGGVFVGPELISQYFHISPQLPYRLPYTERELWDCGQCALFPTVPRIGYRKEKTSILKLRRAPEAKRLFRRTQSLAAPWFRDEPWAKEPLDLGWHLVRLELRGKGDVPRVQAFYTDHERPPSPNVAFWMLLLIPEHVFAGEAFFTDEKTHGGKSIVTIGRAERGAIRIDHTPTGVRNRNVGTIAEIVPQQ